MSAHGASDFSAPNHQLCRSAVGDDFTLASTPMAAYLSRNSGAFAVRADPWVRTPWTACALRARPAPLDVKRVRADRSQPHAWGRGWWWSPQENALPQWLQEAAAEMAAGGVTTNGSATSFGYTGFVGSGTPCVAPIDMSSGGLLDHVRSLLLLRPISLHDVWLRKVRRPFPCPLPHTWTPAVLKVPMVAGALQAASRVQVAGGGRDVLRRCACCAQAEHLIKRGHYAAARNLLHRARAHAASCDQPEAEARAFLMEAKAEKSVCNYTGAIQLIQKAQAIGGACARPHGLQPTAARSLAELLACAEPVLCSQATMTFGGRRCPRTSSAAWRRRTPPPRTPGRRCRAASSCSPPLPGASRRLCGSVAWLCGHRLQCTQGGTLTKPCAAVGHVAPGDCAGTTVPLRRTPCWRRRRSSCSSASCCCRT